MTPFLQNGWYVRWSFPAIDFDRQYEGLPKFMNAIRGTVLYDVLLSFLFKFTGLEEWKIQCFLDGFSLAGMIEPLCNSLSVESPVCLEETGEVVLHGSMTGKTNMRQRHDFLFLLLKCKYEARQCQAILDYYQVHPEEMPQGDIKDVACRMVKSGNGIEPCSYDFIKDVSINQSGFYPEWDTIYLIPNTGMKKSRYYPENNIF